MYANYQKAQFTESKREIPDQECVAFPVAAGLTQARNDTDDWTFAAPMDLRWGRNTLSRVHAHQLIIRIGPVWPPRGRASLKIFLADGKFVDLLSTTVSSEALAPKPCLLGPLHVHEYHGRYCRNLRSKSPPLQLVTLIQLMPSYQRTVGVTELLNETFSHDVAASSTA